MQTPREKETIKGLMILVTDIDRDIIQCYLNNAVIILHYKFLGCRRYVFAK